jgi:hypothetical protein
MAYGRKGADWYVNSAQRMSQVKVREVFGDLERGDGSVPMSYILTITKGADLIGNWQIRSYIEAQLLPEGWNSGIGRGKAKLSAARRQAQRLMHELAFTRVEGIPYISKADLDARLDQRKAAIHERLIKFKIS